MIDTLRAENESLREEVRQLRDLLAPETTVVPIEWGLTPTETRVYAHLASRERATKESIYQALYSGAVGENVEIKIIDVFVCKIRKKLRPFGVRIATIWGVGYRLEVPTDD